MLFFFGTHSRDVSGYLRSEFLLKLPKDVEVKYFMGALPDGDEGEHWDPSWKI